MVVCTSVPINVSSKRNAYLIFRGIFFVRFLDAREEVADGGCCSMTQ